MLLPRRVKHRKVMRGRMSGQAKGGFSVAFGDFGLAVSVNPPPASETYTPPAGNLGPSPTLSPSPDRSVSPSPAGSG